MVSNVIYKTINVITDQYILDYSNGINYFYFRFELNAQFWISDQKVLCSKSPLILSNGENHCIAHGMNKTQLYCFMQQESWGAYC